MIRTALIALALAAWAGLAAAQDDDLQLRAESGDAAAQMQMALRYNDGDGVLQDYAQAARWAALAAQAGVPAAQNLLGRYLYEGRGVDRDRDAALRWLGAAAQAGAPQHLYDFALALEPADPATAAQAYEAAAAQGLADAAVSLGVLYQEGRGVAQDFDRARALFDPAAAAGDARAQNNLGLLYVRGDGVDQDYDRAAQLFTAAAEAGLKPAMTNLGVLYENGFGVELNEDLAAELYRRAGAADPAAGDFVYDSRLTPPQPGPALDTAAAAGDPVAMFQAAWLLVGAETPAHADLARAARLFAAAAGAGHAPAMANLGKMYFDGAGLPQDYVLGQMWLTRADLAGLPESAGLLAHYADRPTAAQLNEAQALARNAGVQRNQP